MHTGTIRLGLDRSYAITFRGNIKNAEKPIGFPYIEQFDGVHSQTIATNQGDAFGKFTNQGDNSLIFTEAAERDKWGMFKQIPMEIERNNDWMMVFPDY